MSRCVMWLNEISQTSNGIAGAKGSYSRALRARTNSKFIENHCCRINSLSHRERVGERGQNKCNCLIQYPLILSFSLREKGRSVCIVATAIDVQRVITVCMNLFIHGVTDNSNQDLWDSSERKYHEKFKPNLATTLALELTEII